MAADGLLGRLFLFELLLVLAHELVDATGSIDQFDLAGKERMAVGANFNADILLGRTCLKSIAAGAPYGCPVILGMDSLFHVYLTSQ